MSFDWYTSDWHIGHKNILKFSNRPYYTITDMNDALIHNYNSLVAKDDVVAMVGDFAFASEKYVTACLARMNGIKILIQGNHDKRTVSAYVKMGFTAVLHRANVKIAGYDTIVSHYPSRQDWHSIHDLKFWDDRPVLGDRQALIHGHTHDTKQRTGRSVHIGVDAWDYKPASSKDVTKLVQQGMHEYLGELDGK